MFAWMDGCMHACTNTYMYISIHIYIYIYTHTHERERNREEGVYACNVTQIKVKPDHLPR